MSAGQDMTLADELPAAVASALAAPAPPSTMTIDAAGIPFFVRGWGSPEDPPLLLVHGVTSSSETWWRVGPALAASRRRVVAPDLPGHGRTGHWTGHRAFADNARDLAALIDAAGIGVDGLAVVGHSWGAMTVAEMPALGVRPRSLVLLDPPAMPLAAMAAMADDPIDRAYDDLDEAVTAIGGQNLLWPYGDVRARAQALVDLDPIAARAVLLENGDWDGAIHALRRDVPLGVPTWLIRGDPAEGGLVPDDAAAAIGEVVGSDHVITITRGTHSPHRLQPAATVAALLRALGAADGAT